LIPDCFFTEALSRVRLRVLHKVVDAKELFIEPVSVEDWELIEREATWLESGGLLEQICIVYPDQIVQLHLQSTLEVAFVRVRHDNFSRHRYNVGIWPEQDQRGDMSQPACLRLVADTQVVVIPKARSERGNQFSPWLRIVPAMEDYKNDVVLRRLALLLGKSIIGASVSIHSLVVHPTTLRGLLPIRLDRKVDTVDLVRLQTSHSILDSGFHCRNRKCSATYAIIRSSVAISENCCGTYPSSSSSCNNV
jgi:Peroxisome biogenesis factor 1, N-terminal